MLPYLLKHHSQTNTCFFHGFILILYSTLVNEVPSSACLCILEKAWLLEWSLSEPLRESCDNGRTHFYHVTRYMERSDSSRKVWFSFNSLILYFFIFYSLNDFDNGFKVHLNCSVLLKLYLLLVTSGNYWDATQPLLWKNLFHWRLLGMTWLSLSMALVSDVTLKASLSETA